MGSTFAKNQRINRIKDHINILRHFNAFRLWNLFLLRVSYIISRITKRNLHRGLPFSLSIEPTTACNLGCPECPSGLKQFTRPTGKLDLTLHESILSQVSKSVSYINYYFQGEPFLHPQFLELIKQAKKHHIYTATSTNGHFITQDVANSIIDSGLDRLIISIDGLTQKTYENYRVNGRLDKVIQATHHLVQAKKEAQSSTPHLIFQFLAVRQNEHEIPQLLSFGKEIGVDEVRIKTAQVYDYQHGNPLIPDNETYSRYKKNADGTYSLKHKTGNRCWRMWSSSVITWNGGIVPCCFDKDAQHILGSLENTTFSKSWKSKQYNLFRSQILHSRNSIDICKNCSEGAKVWA